MVNRNEHNAHPLVINWHVTEGCNYSCKFCFAHWAESANEIWRNPGKTETLIREIGHFASPENTLWENRFNGRPRLKSVSHRMV